MAPSEMSDQPAAFHRAGSIGMMGGASLAQAPTGARVAFASSDSVDWRNDPDLASEASTTDETPRSHRRRICRVRAQKSDEKERLRRLRLQSLKMYNSGDLAARATAAAAARNVTNPDERVMVQVPVRAGDRAGHTGWAAKPVLYREQAVPAFSINCTFGLPTVYPAPMERPDPWPGYSPRVHRWELTEAVAAAAKFVPREGTTYYPESHSAYQLPMLAVPAGTPVPEVAPYMDNELLTSHRRPVSTFEEYTVPKQSHPLFSTRAGAGAEHNDVVAGAQLHRNIEEALMGRQSGAAAPRSRRVDGGVAGGLRKPKKRAGPRCCHGGKCAKCKEVAAGLDDFEDKWRSERERRKREAHYQQRD
jgi:hypothetical protein